MSLRDVLRTPVGHIPCSQILDRMESSHNLCRRRPQDVGRGRPMVLHIGQNGGFLKTVHWDVLRTSDFNILKMLVEDALRTLAGTSLGIIQRTMWGRPQDIFWGRSQDVLVTYFCQVGRFLATHFQQRYSCTRLNFANKALVEIQAQLPPSVQQRYNFLFGGIFYL